MIGKIVKAIGGNPLGYAGLGLNLLGTFQQRRGVSAQNAANAQQAHQQMNFQKYMSNTAYQRQVADMKAAGINPMLSAKIGGASSPAGAQARMENERAHYLASAGQAAQIRNLNAQARKTEAEAEDIETYGDAERQAGIGKILSETTKNELEGAFAAAGVKLRESQIKNIDEMILKIKSEIRVNDKTANKIYQETIKAANEIGLIKNQVVNSKLLADQIKALTKKYLEAAKEHSSAHDRNIQSTMLMSDQMNLTQQEAGRAQEQAKYFSAQRLAADALAQLHGATKDKHISEKELNEMKAEWYDAMRYLDIYKVGSESVKMLLDTLLKGRVPNRRIWDWQE